MTLTGTRFVEVAADVHVLRYPVLDVNSVLVIGSEIAAVIDTLSTPDQGRELLAAVRAVTDRPLVIINTHHHFDHIFGNGVLADSCPGSTIWAHEAAAAELREHGTLWQRQWYEECLALHPDLAEPVLHTELRPANRTIHTESTMDIGGRLLELRHLGRGHTEGDLVVLVEDAGVLIAGDLVEQGSPPSFADSYPLDWPDTVTALLHLGAAATTVVPGHGAPVDLAFVHGQHDELSQLAWLIRDGHRDGAPAAAVAERAPYPASVALPAVTRGYAELDGQD